MRAWVAQRRQAGAMLTKPVALVETPAPFELIVATVTDRGQRRPTKIARFIPPGTRRAVAELISPRLVWFRGFSFVLTGMDELADSHGTTEVAQVWMCKLALPEGATGLVARSTHHNGVPVPRRELNDRNATRQRGGLAVAGVYVPAVGRYTTRADLFDPAGSAWQHNELLDCDLDWMSEERFALSGFSQMPAYADKPARLLRQGWLLDYDIPPPEEGSRSVALREQQVR